MAQGENTALAEAVASVAESPAEVSMVAFLKKARAAQSKLQKHVPPDAPKEGIWYRGQADHEWKLVPGLFRTESSFSLESKAYREWVRRSALIEKPEDNEWEHLFNMQHYGVPTRLLDWTENFAFAVGFSLVFSNFGEHSLPRIFLLNPVALNEKTTQRKKVFEIPEDKTFSYRSTYVEGNGIMPVGPVAIRPSSYSYNRRADNQSGVFTIHDNSGGPIDDLPDNIVTSFVIEKEDIPGASLFLELCNVNAYRIYPDFAGLAGYIRAMLTSKKKN
jgi:hypothetical protein